MAEQQSSWFSKWRTGCWLAKQAVGIFPETVRDYNRPFGYFEQWLAVNPRPREVSAQDVKAFLAWLRERPNGNDPTARPSPKAIQNAHIARKSFFRWYADETGQANTVQKVPEPRSAEPLIDPLTRDEVRRALDACNHEPTVQRPGRKPTRRSGPARCATAPSCWCCSTRLTPEERRRIAQEATRRVA